MNKKYYWMVFLLLNISYMTSICVAKKLPVILIIGTGGTIAGKADSTIAANYHIGQINIENLLAMIPKVNKSAVLRCKQVLNVSSSDLTNKDLLTIANVVNTALADKNIDAVVITHGTDTMEETAYFLNLTVKSNKPVVITGSMRPANSISADGPMNLLNAIAVASCPDSMNKGVLVVFNNKIFDSRNVTKVHASNIDAFASTNGEELGHVIMSEVNYYYQPLRKHTLETPFNVKELTELPRVIILSDYIGSSSDILEKAIYLGVAGIVYAGTGNGDINKSSWNFLQKAREKGIIIVRSSRAGRGFITFNSLENLDSKLGLIPADNLNPQKARILLMLALTRTQDTKMILKFFKEF